MRSAVFVQVRLGSQRLPEKAMLPMCGTTMISWVLQAMKAVDADIHAVVTDADSAPTLRLMCKEHGFECFAGSPDDVLDRFVSAARLFKADYILRATGDNPLLDIQAARQSLPEAITNAYDYFTYTGMPLGTGVEVLSRTGLERAWFEAKSSYYREHVAPWLYHNPSRFNVSRIPNQMYEAEARRLYRGTLPSFTVDTLEDFEYVSWLLSLNGRKLFSGLLELLALAHANSREDMLLHNRGSA